MTRRREEKLRFRPSVYSHGVVPLRFYTTGIEPRYYGATEVKTDEVGSTCTDWPGLLGKKGAKVPCYLLKAALEGKPLDTYKPYEEKALELPDFDIPNPFEPFLDWMKEWKKRMEIMQKISLAVFGIAAGTFVLNRILSSYERYQRIKNLKEERAREEMA